MKLIYFVSIEISAELFLRKTLLLTIYLIIKTIILILIHVYLWRLTNFVRYLTNIISWKFQLLTFLFQIKDVHIDFYLGPFVKIDKLCEMFDRIRLPDLPVSTGTDPNSVHLFDLAKVGILFFISLTEIISRKQENNISFFKNIILSK